MFATVAAVSRKVVGKSRIAALLAPFALVVAMAIAGLASTAPPAQADGPCQGTSHWHYHFPYAHSDYWHDHGFTNSGGVWYRVWHIHNHGDYRWTRCS